MKNKLLVREVEARDIPLIGNYWSGLSEADAERMHLNRSQLPSQEALAAYFSKLLSMPASDRPSDPLMWEVDSKTIGLANINNIEKGKQADVHLHIFHQGLRGKGIGKRLFALSVQEYFRRHPLNLLICEPAFSNPGPNAALKALQIPVAKKYIKPASSVTLQHEVNRYEISRSMVDGILRQSQAPPAKARR